MRACARAPPTHYYADTPLIKRLSNRKKKCDENFALEIDNYTRMILCVFYVLYVNPSG